MRKSFIVAKTPGTGDGTINDVIKVSSNLILQNSIPQTFDLFEMKLGPNEIYQDLSNFESNFISFKNYGSNEIEFYFHNLDHR